VHFGSAWTGAEMLPLWARHVASASAERRTLVAEALQQLSGAVDLAAQGHSLLGSVQRLCEDRLEQVGRRLGHPPTPSPQALKPQNWEACRRRAGRPHQPHCLGERSLGCGAVGS
jgi:hypothetical protein